MNDCYWSPKLRRDDVPFTSALPNVALPELKHCEVSDSALSTLFIPHYASLRYAALYGTIRATLRSSRYSALLCASLRYAALLYATLRYIALLRYVALHCTPLRYTALYRAIRTSLRFSALLCAKLHSYDAALYCASTIPRYIALLQYAALHCAPLRCCATLRLTICCATPRHAMLPCATPHYASLRYTALCCATLHYSRLSRSILHSILFYKL